MPEKFIKHLCVSLSKKELAFLESVKNKTENYMKNSIELLEWLNETFEKINEYTENDCLFYRLI